MSEVPQLPEDSPAELADDYDHPPERELTPAEQERAFRAQLILFLVMGIFIIVPFILWWWLSTRPS